MKMSKCVVNLITHVDIGQVLVISGTLTKESTEFKINFCDNGDKSSSEIPLSIETNVSEKKVTLKSIANSDIKSEEVFDVKSIGDNSVFKFYILTLDDKFRIAVDDNHLCSFKYQNELSVIKMIKLSGDIESVKQVDHRRVYPYSWPLSHEDFASCSFSSDVPCRFPQNTLIVLRMKLSGDDKNGSFFIRFNERGSKKQLFHFNPRFNERIIICNSMNDRLEWQTEMRCSDFPFVIDADFQIAFFMDSAFFHVAVNGHHILRYPFKTVQSTLLRASKDHSIYEKLTGFKMFAQNGLKLSVSYVDTFIIPNENDSKFYEIFSNMNFN